MEREQKRREVERQPRRVTDTTLTISKRNQLEQKLIVNKQKADRLSPEDSTSESVVNKMNQVPTPTKLLQLITQITIQPARPSMQKKEEFYHHRKRDPSQLSSLSARWKHLVPKPLGKLSLVGIP